MNYPIPEREHAINGVSGRIYPIHAPQMVRGRLVYRAQKWVSEGRPVKGYGTNGVMHVEIRFDDKCGNAHQTFAITASVYTTESRRQRDIAAGGCMHEEIAATFPELAPLIRWHLVSTDGPMHYVENAVYFASNRDLNAARSAAIWPEATDEELSADPETLKAALLARLPGLMAEFRAAVESAGFMWEPDQPTADGGA